MNIKDGSEKQRIIYKVPVLCGVLDAKMPGKKAHIQRLLKYKDEHLDGHSLII